METELIVTGGAGLFFIGVAIGAVISEILARRELNIRIRDLRRIHDAEIHSVTATVFNMGYAAGKRSAER